MMNSHYTGNNFSAGLQKECIT